VAWPRAPPTASSANPIAKPPACCRPRSAIPTSSIPAHGGGAGRSDFTFAGLKDAPATVFLVLPPDRLATYARWLRLMVAQALTELARAPAVRPGRCCSCSMSSPRSAVSNPSSARWG
jgi:hypothetical protein